MSKLAFVFPGQGSQAVGMGKDLYDHYEESKWVFDEANEILGFSLTDLCFNGPDTELIKTQNTQPALLVTSVAALRILEKEGIKPDLCAGHSLGEYSAYVAAGKLAFADAVKIVRKRGELMASADKEGKGTMGFIMGLEESKVKEACEKASSKGIVVPANFNSSDQIVISGEKAAVEEALSQAKALGAKRADFLNVSGAFHSPLMEKASTEFAAFLKDFRISASSIPVISNVYAESLPDENVMDSLVKQLTGAVQWTKSILKMEADGITSAVEVGSGKVLQGLIKRISKSINLSGCSDSSAISKFLEEQKIAS